MKIHLNMIFRIALLAIPLYLNNIHGFTQDRVLITDFGCKPGDNRDVISCIKAALEVCATHDSSILVFPKGRYDFWQDFSARSTIGIKMDKLNNVTIDGSGSEFIFHGNMQIANISNCDNVTLRNFSVDWDHPWIYQGEYVAATDEYIEIKFDRQEYPYVIEDSLFYLTGEGWKVRPLNVWNYKNNLFDRDTKEILYRSYDGMNSSLFHNKAEEVGPGIVRFYGHPAIKPVPGTITVIYAGRFITTGIQIVDSKNTYLKDLTIYHALSNGVNGNRCENITMDNASTKMNGKKNRVFSTIADASHFTNCRGLIRVVNCAHTGNGDDFINVQGTYTKVESINDESSIITTRDPRHNRPGDELWFVNPILCQRSEARTIKSKEPIIKDGQSAGTKMTFTQPLPKGVQAGDYMENKTWSPNVEIRNCKILKNHRARGILVTTPYKVVIENNYFRTAGTAILIEGDMDMWWESGANTDVSIRNNTFEDCLTSGCATGRRSEWGEAIITITPSHRPVNERTEPYHKNIRIEDNIFKTFDIPLIHARSVRGLTFNNNDVIRTYTFEPYAWQKSSFKLDGCREVTISGNRMPDDYSTRLIEIEHMKKSDLKVDDNQKFNIMPIDNLPKRIYIDDYVNPKLREFYPF
jgi:hypothetical protein